MLSRVSGAGMRRALSSVATVARHRPVMKLNAVGTDDIEAKRPMVAWDAWVAPNASVVGDVIAGDEVSIWYGAVVRGDCNQVKFGALVNVQEKTVINTVPSLESGFPSTVDIGDYVSIGAGSVLTSCTIGNNVEIGAGCVVCEGALLESKSKLAPGSVLGAYMRVPTGELWGGNPAAFVSTLSEDEEAAILELAETMAIRARECNDEYMPIADAP